MTCVSVTGPHAWRRIPGHDLIMTATMEQQA
jgi:hypothetical protein